MAGLGIGPVEFATFRIVDPDERERALERAVLPALTRIGDSLLAGLSRLAAAPLVQQPGKMQRRKDAPPQEALVAFCPAEKLHTKVPHLAIATTRGHLHARVIARAAADRDGAIRRALQREAPNL